MKKTILICCGILILLVNTVLAYELILQDPDTEVLNDAWVRNGSSQSNRDRNYGTDTVGQMQHIFRRTYIMFDLSDIVGDNLTISNATLNFYSQNIPSADPVNVTFHHVLVYNWSEGTEDGIICDVASCTYENNITWSNQVCGEEFDNSELCNLSVEGWSVAASDNSWMTSLVVSSAFKRTFNNGSLRNISFVSNSTNSSRVGIASVQTTAKESTLESQRPYLNVSFTFNQPEVKLQEFVNGSEVAYANRPFVFNFTINDSTYKMVNATLWGNFSGTWTVNETNSTIVYNSTTNYTQIKSINIDKGFYIWNIYACDSNEVCKFAPENFTLNVTNSKPTYSIALTDPLEQNYTLEISMSSFSDADGDTHTSNETRWYINGTYDNTLDDAIYIGSGNLTVNENWTVETRIYDGFEWTDWVNTSVNITDFTNPVFYNASMPITGIVNEYGNIWLNITDNWTRINTAVVELEDPGNKKQNHSLSVTGGNNNPNQISEWGHSHLFVATGTWYAKYYFCDEKSNCDSSPDRYNNITITTSDTAPGGGGGVTTIEKEAEIDLPAALREILYVTGDGVCQSDKGERPWNSEDCIPNLDTIIFCFPPLEHVPIVNKMFIEATDCAWEQAWFLQGAVLALVGIFIVTETKNKKKIRGR